MSRPDIPVTISGDPKGFESAMARIRAMTKTTAGDITSSFLAIKSRIGGIGGLVAATGVTAAIGAVREAAGAIAEIGAAARRAGVDVKSFQELKFVAEQNKIGVDALTDGLKELSLRADEFIVTGGGAAAESFLRLGLNAQMLKEKLKDPSALFTEIIGKLGDLDKAAQIRVLDEIFGGAGGEQFLQLIRLGEKGIQDLIQAAHKLGLVFDEDMIKKADEIDKKFNVITNVIGTNLKGAIVGAASALIEFLDNLHAIEERMGAIGNSDFFKSLSKGLGVDTSKVYRVVPGQGIVAEDPKEAGEKTAATPKSTPKVGRVPNALDILKAKLIDEKVANAFGTSPASPSSSSSRSSGAKSAKEEEAAYVGVIKALKEELQLIGKSDVERDKMTALREAGVAATSKEGQEIEKLIELKYRQQAAEDALLAKREQAQQAAEDFGSTLDDQLDRVIDGTFEARDALSALVDELINASTGGKGLFASLFGALSGGGSNAKLFSPDFTPNTTLGGILGYGGARAGGGDVSPGRIYRVNEYEDEFFSPGSHGRIVAPSKLQGGGSGSDDGAGHSLVEISLGEGLVGKILEQSGKQTVQFIQRDAAARENRRQNGGDS
jgi:hypothetical protein